MVHFLIAALACLLPPPAFAQSIERLTYEGRLEKDDGEPVESANVPFRLEIRSEAPGQCLLYRWETTKNMTNSGGDFTIVIGDTNSGSTSSPHSLTDIFSKSLLSVPSADCLSGAGNVGGGPRRLHVFAKIDGISWTDFGSIPISHAPRAWRADRIGEFSEADLLKVNTTADLTQTSLEQLFSVLKTAPGTSATWNGSAFVSYDPKDGAGLTTASVPDSALSSVSWSKVTSVPTPLEQFGGLSCTSGQIAKYNGSAWTCAADETGGGGGGTLSTLNGDSSPSQTLAVSTSGTAVEWTTAAGTHTLKIPFAATSGVTAGLLSNVDHAKFTAAASAVENAGATGAPDTLVKRDASGSAAFGSVTLENGGSSITHQTPAGTGATIYSWPHAPSIPGQILRSGTDGILSWSTLNLSDMKNSSGQAQLPTASCAPSQALSWSSLTDSFNCTDIVVTGGALRTKTGMTFFVRTHGDDTLCNGTSDTAPPGTPTRNCAFATLQHALDALPEQISHDITIDIDGTFQISDTIVLGKKGNFASGRKLSIESTGTAAIFEPSASGISGFVVLPTMQNLRFKNVRFRGFTGQGPLMEAAALRVNGGLVLLDSVNFEGNLTAIEINHAGRVYFMKESGPSQTNVTCSWELDCTGISVRNGEIGSMQNADLYFENSSDNQTLLRLEKATADFSSNVEFHVAGNNSTAIRVENGSSFRAEGALSVEVNGSSNTSGVTVSNSRFDFGSESSSNTFSLQTVSGRLFSLENGAHAVFRGPVTAFGGNTTVFSVRRQSALTVSGSLDVNGSAPGGLLRAEEQSSFTFEDHSTNWTHWSFSGSSSSGIALDSQSLLTLKSGSGKEINLSGLSAFVQATGGSRIAAIFQNADFSGANSLPLQADSTSTVSIDPTFGPSKFVVTGGLSSAANAILIGRAEYQYGRYRITNLPLLPNLNAETVFQFQVTTPNPGSIDMDVNGKIARIVDSDTGNDFNSGEIKPGEIYKAFYDGYVFRVSKPPPKITKLTINPGIGILSSGTAAYGPYFASSYSPNAVINCHSKDEMTDPIFISPFYDFGYGAWRLRFKNSLGVSVNIPYEFNCTIVD